jgi:hypothetical protein
VPAGWAPPDDAESAHRNQMTSGHVDDTTTLRVRSVAEPADMRPIGAHKLHV